MKNTNAKLQDYFKPIQESKYDISISFKVYVWSVVCHGGQLPWWSGGYDTRLECERLGFDPLLRHWIFWPVRTHCYIWPPITGFIDLFIWSKREDTLSPEGVNVMADSCLGGLVAMTLAQNARDQGSIPSWGTEFFGPSEGLRVGPV